MLYLVYTYAGTLMAIATAIGGLLWAFFKWGGQTAVEQWLKRNYKAWELEAEKPYKEDFKRFEDTINKIATRESTRYTLAYTRRADAIKTIHSLMFGLERRLSRYLNYKAIARHDLKYIEMAEEAERKVSQRLQDFEINVNEASFLFTPEMKSALLGLWTTGRITAVMIEQDKPYEVVDSQLHNLRTELKNIEEQFRQLVDTLILES